MTRLSETRSADPVIEADLGGAGGPLTSLAELVRWASEIMFLLDGDGTVLYAGGSLLRLLGHDPVALTGAPFADVLGPIVDGPVALSSRSGTPVPFVLRVSPLDGGGQFVGATDQSTAHVLVAGPEHDERAGLIVFRLDERGTLRAINRRWTQLTGQSVDDALGVGWLQYIHDEDRRTLRAVSASAHQHQQGWTQRFRVRRPNGQWVTVDAALARTPDGESVGVVVPG